MSDTPTIQEQCYGTCWAASNRIEDLERELAEAKAGAETLLEDYRALINKSETNLYRKQRDEVERKLAQAKDQLKEHQDQLEAHKAALEKCHELLTKITASHFYQSSCRGGEMERLMNQAIELLKGHE